MNMLNYSNLDFDQELYLNIISEEFYKIIYQF